jgi:hypothetical protein
MQNLHLDGGVCLGSAFEIPLDIWLSYVRLENSFDPRLSWYSSCLSLARLENFTRSPSLEKPQEQGNSLGMT